MTTIEKSGPYIGPRGGKWADPAHTIPWDADNRPTPRSGKREADEEGSAGGYAEITRDEAVRQVLVGIPKNVLSGWLRNADRAYKPKIAEAIDTDQSLRNATLNVLHQQYQISTGRRIPFSEFLDTPISLHRAGETPPSESFSSYSYDRAIADKFADQYGVAVHTIEMKPRDTYGMINEMGEGEVLVPLATEHSDKFAEGTTIQVRGKPWRVVRRAARIVYLQSEERPDSKPMKITEDKLASLTKANTEGSAMATTILMGPNIAGRDYKGTLNYMGILLGVEHEQGAVNPWSKKKTRAAYGEIPGTQNIDGDPVDFLLGDNPDSDIVFVIQQEIPNTQADPHVGLVAGNGGLNQYDEDKIVLGAWTEADARALYDDYYQGSGRTVGGVVVMSVEYLREVVLFCPVRAGLPVFKSLAVPQARGGWPRAAIARLHPRIFPQIDAIVAKSPGDPLLALQAALPRWGLIKGQTGGDKPAAPDGFEPIPKGKKGGYRKKKASGKGYDYWYPGQHEVHHHPDWEPDPTAGTGVEGLSPGAFVFVLGMGANTLFRYNPDHGDSDDGMTWARNLETGQDVAVRETNIQRARGFDRDERDKKEKGRRPRPRDNAGRRSSGDNRRDVPDRPRPATGGKKKKRPPVGPPDYRNVSPDAPRTPTYTGEGGAPAGTVKWNLENGVYLQAEFAGSDGHVRRGAFIPPEHHAAFLDEHNGMLHATAQGVAKKLGVKIRDSQGPTPGYEEVFAGAQLGLLMAVQNWNADLPFAAHASRYMTTYAREAAARELGRGLPISSRHRRMIEGFLAARARAWSAGGDDNPATIARNWNLTKKQAAPDVDWGRYAYPDQRGDEKVRDQGTMAVPMGPWQVLGPDGKALGEQRPGKIALVEDLLTYTSGDRMASMQPAWMEYDNRAAILPAGDAYALPVGTALFYRQEVDDILADMPDNHRQALILRWGLDGAKEMDYADIAAAMGLGDKPSTGNSPDEAATRRVLRYRGKKAVDAATDAFKRSARAVESPVGGMAGNWSSRGPDAVKEPSPITGPSQGELVARFGGGPDGEERHRIYLAGVGLGMGEEFAKVLEQEPKGGVPEAQSRAIREAYHEYRDQQRLKTFQRQTRHATIDPGAARDVVMGSNPVDVSEYGDDATDGYMQLIAKRGLPGPGSGGPPKRAGLGSDRVWSQERLDRFLGRWRAAPAPSDQSSEG